MSSAHLIDGNIVSSELRETIARRTVELNLTPGLAVVLVGDDPASQVYVRNKHKRAVEVGFQSFEHRLPDSTGESDLLALIDQLNADPAVHGILVQLPLPEQIDEQKVIARIRPEKDVDGFHPINVGNLASGAPALVPCTPMGCLIMLKRELGDLGGKRAIVIGRSNIVGKPMAQLLLRESCTVTIAHSKTRDLPEECRRADIVVAAVGKPLMVKGDWIKPGAVVIDVGINRVPAAEPGKTRLVGDVDFDSAVKVAGAITPVPGGVGPMTIAVLLRESATVTIAHSKTRDLAEECRRADIVVAAVGRPLMVKGDWIKPGAVVIDVGINRVPAAEEGKTRLVGDVDFAEAVKVAGAITPVPGGVGPMTIAVLLRNTLEACCRQKGLPFE